MERNLPPAPVAAPPQIAVPKLAADQDATPLGVALTALVVLGPEAGVQAGVGPGLHLASGSGLDTPQARRRLGAFLHRPLSRKLIGEIEATITRDYRRRGLPLVSVSTPEQDVATGVLQVRVIEFRLQAKSAPGARSPGYVQSRVRAPLGQPVDADTLSQDLDWLNRFPFRNSQASFTPGDGLGTTRLLLQTTQSRPWSVYAGYGDSGSPLTGFDRYFAGATVSLPGLHDAYAAYQFTGSNDVLFAQDRPFNSAPQPLYLSHSGRVVIPTLPRQDVEATLSFVQSNEVTDFTARQTTMEASLAYRSALSNLAGGLPGEATVGLEARRETGQTLFVNEPVQSGGVDVFQIYASYSAQESDRAGRTSGELAIHVSPGGVTHRNTDAVFVAASQGRSTSAEYGYMSGDISRTFGLPGSFGYSLQVIGQYGPRALPLTEQIGLGGSSLVRGYTLDDGVFDSGLVARSEVRRPALPGLAGLLGKTADQLSPFAFVDAGYGKNAYTHADSGPVGAGLGADYQFGPYFSADLTTAWALRPEGLTRSGQFRLYSRLTLTF